jgi:hypothetical protein
MHLYLYTTCTFLKSFKLIIFLTAREAEPWRAALLLVHVLFGFFLAS